MELSKLRVIITFAASPVLLREQVYVNEQNFKNRLSRVVQAIFVNLALPGLVYSLRYLSINSIKYLPCALDILACSFLVQSVAIISFPCNKEKQFHPAIGPNHPVWKKACVHLYSLTIIGLTTRICVRGWKARMVSPIPLATGIGIGLIHGGFVVHRARKGYPNIPISKTLQAQNEKENHDSSKTLTAEEFVKLLNHKDMQPKSNQYTVESLQTLDTLTLHPEGGTLSPLNTTDLYSYFYPFLPQDTFSSTNKSFNNVILQHLHFLPRLKKIDLRDKKPWLLEQSVRKFILKNDIQVRYINKIKKNQPSASYLIAEYTEWNSLPAEKELRSSFQKNR